MIDGIPIFTYDEDESVWTFANVENADGYHKTIYSYERLKINYFSMNLPEANSKMAG